MAYEDEEFDTQGYVEAPIEDVEDSNQGYQAPAQNASPEALEDESVPRQETVDVEDSGAAPAGAGDTAIPDDFGPVVPPEEEQAPPENERSWVTDLLDYTRGLFGINEEAIPDEATERPGTRREEPATAQEPPPLTPESSINEVAGRALGKLSDTIGGAVQRAVAPSEGEQQNLNTPQEGPLKRMMREYVMGEGAMDNAERKQREAQAAANANPGSNLTSSEVRQQALKAAAAESLDKGAAMLQNYRVNQQNYRGLSSAALDSNKPSARDDAAKLFNEGHTYVPDGGHAVVSATTNGFLATVRDSATGQTQATMLTDDQMRELLHKPPGEFDHLTERGLANMLNDVARSPGLSKEQVGRGAPGAGNAPANMSATAGVANVGNQSARPAAGAPGTAPARPPTGGFLSKGPAAAAPAGAPKNAVEAATRVGGTWPGQQRGGQGSDTGRNRGPAVGPTSMGFGNQRPGDVISGRSNRMASGAGDIEKPQYGAVGKYGRDVRDPDGWPSGIPRGGSFAGNHYDAHGHTYDVDKNGMPLAQRGQPGWHGPQQGERGWNGTPGLNPTRSPMLGGPGDRPPQLLNRPSGPAARADATAASRERIAADRNAIEREKLKARGETTTKTLEEKAADRQRKETQGRGSLDVKREGLAQKDRHLEYLRTKSEGDVEQKERSRLSRDIAAAGGQSARVIGEKIRQGLPLSDAEIGLTGELQRRALQAPPPARTSGGGGGERGGAPTIVNARGDRMVLQNGQWVPAPR